VFRVVDALLFHGNELDLDINNIAWRRVLDVNDRALRNLTIGMGEGSTGYLATPDST